MLYGFVLLAWARFLYAWRNLHAVLQAMGRHPVRLALNDLPHGRSVLQVLRGTGTYALRGLVTRSLEILRVLAPSQAPGNEPCAPIGCNEPRAPLTGNEPRAPLGGDEARRGLWACLQTLENSVCYWEGVAGCSNRDALATVRSIDRCLLETGILITKELERFWRQGSPAVLERPGNATSSATATLPKTVVLGREFIAIQYVMFACNAMRQLRNTLLYLTIGFFLGILSVIVYPFRSQAQVVWLATANFVVLGLPVALAIVQMESDDTLRRLTDSTRRGTAATVLLRLMGYGALPVLGLVTSHVPAIGRLLASVVEPALRALQ